MMAALKTYLLTICAACALISVVLTVFPDTWRRGAATLAGGLILVYVMIRPLPGIDWGKIAEELASSRFPAEQTASFAAEETEDRIRDIIKEKCEAYIWDKATAMGISVKEIRVAMDPTGESMLPEGARISGSFTEQQRQSLSRSIREDLGIRTENQEWIWE